MLEGKLINIWDLQPLDTFKVQGDNAVTNVVVNEVLSSGGKVAVDAISVEDAGRTLCEYVFDSRIKVKLLDRTSPDGETEYFDY